MSIGGAHPDRRTRESTIKPSGRETAGRETDTEGSSAHGGKRNTVLSKVRGLTIGGAGTGGVHDHAAGMHSALAEGSAKEVVEELPWLSTLLNDTRGTFGASHDLQWYSGGSDHPLAPLMGERPGVFRPLLNDDGKAGVALYDSVTGAPRWSWPIAFRA